MASVGGLGWSAAELSAIDRQYDEIFERHDGGTIDDGDELAPAYKDDVGVMSGLRRTRHLACLVSKRRSAPCMSLIPSAPPPSSRVSPAQVHISSHPYDLSPSSASALACASQSSSLYKHARLLTL